MKFTNNLPNTVSIICGPTDNNHDLFSRVLDHYRHSASNSSDDAIPADSFITRVVDSRENRAKQQDFEDSKKAEVDALIKQNV